MSGAAANDSKVETISRLAQWRIDSFGPNSYLRSDAFKLGLWNWFLSVAKKRYMYIRLFPEPCKVSKEQPPIARFVVRVSGPGPGRRPHVSPVFERLLRTSEDFVWPVDSTFHGHFVVDVEFLDLKVSSLNSGDSCSIWPNKGILQSLSRKSTHRFLSRMLEEGIHVDVTINTSDGSLKAHKAVLASSSPVFERMFLEKELSVIEIEDMSLESCSALLGYVYGTIKQEDFWTHRLALAGAANRYDITDLKECCQESLLEDINSSNVLHRLHEAWLYRLNKLKKGCLTYLFGFGKIYDVSDINNFFRHADKELALEMFQEILTIWKPV